MKRNLTKTERIKSKDDFKRLYASPLGSKTLGAKLVFSNSGSGMNRLGISLVRKFGTSVQRNRAKRLIREIYRCNKHRVKPGFDLLFVLFPGDFGYDERSRQFFALLEKADLLEPAA